MEQTIGKSREEVGELRERVARMEAEAEAEAYEQHGRPDFSGPLGLHS
jgi:hypothetical protein